MQMPLRQYKVLWVIDIEAHSPRDAAELARSIQMREDSIATVFDVVSPNGDTQTVDLQEDLQH